MQPGTAGAVSDNFTYNFFAVPVVVIVTLPALLVFTDAYLALDPFALFFVDQVTFAVAFCPALVTTAFFSSTVLPLALDLLRQLHARGLRHRLLRQCHRPDQVPAHPLGQVVGGIGQQATPVVVGAGYVVLATANAPVTGS